MSAPSDQWGEGAAAGADDLGIRLSKRVAKEQGCSRTDAERLIAAGAIRVDGEVVCEPQRRVRTTQAVAVAALQAPLSSEPLSVLWFKPAGVVLPEGGHPPQAWLRTHLRNDMLIAGEGTAFQGLGPRWELLAPMGSQESGLVLVSQHPSVVRHLTESSGVLEQEWLLDVGSDGGPDAKAEAIRSLQAPLSHQGRWLSVARASWQSDTRIRLAVKGAVPGQVAYLVQRSGLGATVLRRQRLGRLSLSGLLPGQWRTLLPTERV